MTRINLISPSELTKKHLVGEYYEIMRIPGALKKSLSRKSKPFDFSEIPTNFVLGKGHVKFFYDKMAFLEKRFNEIVHEMEKRGIKANFKKTNIFRKNIPNQFFNSYSPDKASIDLSKKRLKEKSPKEYRF